MVETRSHQYGGTDAQEASKPKTPPSKKATTKHESETPQKRSLPDTGAQEDSKVDTDGKEGSPKRRRRSSGGSHKKTQETRSESTGSGDLKELANRVLDKYGDKPLKDLVDESWPEGKMVMAHILNAMLSSARISHDIARSSLKALLDAGYEDLETLHKSTWEERTEVLTKGGYKRYRERMANFLGDLMELMKEKYDDDAARILPSKGDKDGDEAVKHDLAAELKEIKGLGPLGVDICMGSMQAYFPEVAPFLDQRSLETARKVGLGDDVEAMFEALGSDAQAMARLEVGLTRVRFEKREGEFAPVGA